ncbi:hypothetical protein JZ751_000547 [Albula glossodonta]|uniref:Uncharacterized protein n=1 Tax=Albula glossodonta TaxID=121402 RepID=A0A8T2PWE6_9TELE|nr:hypothetical protein JZ751_000547 [Albula glossodonta]
MAKQAAKLKHFRRSDLAFSGRQAADEPVTASPLYVAASADGEDRLQQWLQRLSQLGERFQGHRKPVTRAVGPRLAGKKMVALPRNFGKVRKQSRNWSLFVCGLESITKRLAG